MWIIGTQYDAGRIARVINPEEVPAGLKSGVWIGGIVDGAVKGSEPVKVSRAKEIPRGWKNCQPGFRGDEVKWQEGYFVEVRNDNEM